MVITKLLIFSRDSVLSSWLVVLMGGLLSKELMMIQVLIFIPGNPVVLAHVLLKFLLLF